MTVLLAALVALVVASTTAAAVAQPAVAAAFDAGIADVGWIVFGYSASFAVFTVVYAQLGPRFGIGRCLVVGIGFLSVGGLVAALAPTLEIVVLGRILSGVGAGAIPTLTIAAVAEHLSGPARIRAIAMNAAGVGVGNVAGPLVGGLLLELEGWRAPLAFGVVAAPAAIAVWRMIPGSGDRSVSIDRIGLACIAAIGAGIVLVLNRVPVSGVTPVVLVGLAAAAGGLVVLRRWVASTRSTMIPPALAADGFLRMVVIAGALTMVGFLGALVVLPPAMARAHHLNGIALGLVLVPMAITVASVSLSSRRLVPSGAPRATVIAAATIGFALIVDAVIGAGAPPIAHAGAYAIMGAGFGLLQAPLITALATRYEGALRSLAIGLFNVIFFLGGAAGGAIGSAILGAGLDLGMQWLADPVVPGFRAAMLVLAMGPLIVAISLAIRIARGPGLVTAPVAVPAGTGQAQMGGH